MICPVWSVSDVAILDFRSTKTDLSKEDYPTEHSSQDWFQVVSENNNLKYVTCTTEH